MNKILIKQKYVKKKIVSLKLIRNIFTEQQGWNGDYITIKLKGRAENG